MSIPRRLLPLLALLLAIAPPVAAQPSGLLGDAAGTTTYTLAARDFGPLTVDLATQGRNGRDQSASFGAGFVHLYLTTINGASPALRASGSTAGAILANGETASLYLASLAVSATNTPLSPQYVRGDRTCTQSRSETGIHVAQNGGIAWVDLTGLVPPNAVEYTIEGSLVYKTNGNGDVDGNLDLFLGSSTAWRHTAPVSINFSGQTPGTYVKQSHGPIVLPVVTGATAIGFYAGVSINIGATDSNTGYYPHVTCWVNG